MNAHHQSMWRKEHFLLSVLVPAASSPHAEMHSHMDVGFSCILWGPQLHTHTHHSSARLMSRDRVLWETTALGRSPWALSLAGDTAHFLCSQEQLLSVYGLHVQNRLLHFSFVIQENGLFSWLAVVGHLWLPGMLLGTAQQVMQKVLAGGFEVICILLMFPQAAVFYWHEPWFSCLNWISLLRFSLLTIFLLSSPVFTCHMHTCAKDLAIS